MVATSSSQYDTDYAFYFSLDTLLLTHYEITLENFFYFQIEQLKRMEIALSAMVDFTILFVDIQRPLMVTPMPRR